MVDARPATSTHPQKMIMFWRLYLKEIVGERIQYGQRVIAAHIRRDGKIPYSLKTVIKVLRQLGLYKPAKRRQVKKRDMRYMSKRLRFGERIQVDIKYLTDIPELKSAMKHGELPRYQITARDCATGALWLGFTKEKSSSTSTTLFIELLLDHLSAYGVDVHDCAIQTDNGREFTSWYKTEKKSLFEMALAQRIVTHRRIPFRACTYNSMVESSHRLIEDECYGNMFLPSYQTFFEKTGEYQRWFNIERMNSYRGGSPLTLLKHKAAEIDPAVLILKPLEVDTLLNRETLERWRSWQKKKDSA